MNKKYEDLGNSIFEWIYTTDNLIESANILKKESYHWTGKFGEMPDFRAYRICDVVTMLYAMAIECLFKAIWLLSGSKLVKKGKFIGMNGITSHHLPSLAKTLTKTDIISFDRNDYKILEELTRNITSGRYPIEKNMHKQYQDFFAPYKKYKVEDNALVTKPTKSFNDIKDLRKKLYDITDPHIEKECPNYLGKTKRWD